MKRSFNWVVLEVCSFIRLAAMSSQKSLLKFASNQHQNSWTLRKVVFFSTSKSCKYKNHMIVGKVLKHSFKWVVLEVCSFIHLEVIIYSSQVSKMKISLRLVLDCSNLFCNIYHLYIKINIKTIWPMERSWKDLSTERL